MIITTYGLGGFCESCEDTHNHPLHNIVEEIEVPDPVENVVVSQPITPLPIAGETVDEVKASAEASINDLANQMQAKIDALTGGV
jgi:hypothetical protein